MFKKVVSLCLSAAIILPLGVKKVNAVEINSKVCKKLCRAKNKHRINVNKKILENIDFYYDKIKKDNYKLDPALEYIFKIYKEQEKDNVKLFSLFYDAICGDLYTCYYDEL